MLVSMHPSMDVMRPYFICKNPLFLVKEIGMGVSLGLTEE